MSLPRNSPRSTTDELVKIILNLTFHSAVTPAIERFVFLAYIIASTLQVQTTPPTSFSKTRKKTSKIPTRQINICKTPSQKVCWSWLFSRVHFFRCRWLIDYSFPVPYRYRYCYYKLQFHCILMILECNPILKYCFRKNIHKINDLKKACLHI